LSIGNEISARLLYQKLTCLSLCPANIDVIQPIIINIRFGCSGAVILFRPYTFLIKRV